jgi:hypothetical protein
MTTTAMTPVRMLGRPRGEFYNLLESLLESGGACWPHQWDHRVVPEPCHNSFLNWEAHHESTGSVFLSGAVFLTVLLSHSRPLPLHAASSGYVPFAILPPTGPRSDAACSSSPKRTFMELQGPSEETGARVPTPC